MPGRLGWVALGVGAYLAFVLTMFPAATAYRWFAPPELALSGVEGTVWSGRAALGSVEGFPLRDLRWQLHPSALLALRLGASFESRLAEGFVSGAVRVGMSTVEFSDIRVATSLAALRAALPLDGLEGRVSLSLERLVLDRGWPVVVVGDAGVNDLQGMWFMAGDQPDFVTLGSYALRFNQGGGNGILASVRDAGGPLEVSGELELGSDRAYRIEGLVRARENASAELVQGLQFMTDDPDASGRRAFSFTGTL
jgi:general secretion pathway protein N